MGKNSFMFALVGALVLVLMLAACGPSLSTVSSITNQVKSSVATETSTADTVTGVSAGQGNTTAASTIRTSEVSEDRAAASVADAAAENSPDDSDATDYVRDSSTVVRITLDGNSATVSGQGVTVDGSTVTITAAGTYDVSGSLADGQIVVNSQDDGIVRLVLNGVELSSSTGAPIYVVDADQVIIVLADNTEHSLSDGASYVIGDAEEDAPNAAIFSMANLTTYGDGSLTVDCRYNDGIASKDGLTIAGGTVAVNAVDDGIWGKDHVVIEDGDITAAAQGDGPK